MTTLFHQIFIFIRDTVFLALGREEAIRLAQAVSVALPFLERLAYVLLGIALAAHIIFAWSQRVPPWRYFGYVFHRLTIVLGLARRYEPWGTVYDAVTKKPLAAARVEILNKQSRVMETKSTDARGRYSFLINTESLLGDDVTFMLRAVKPNYVFPSKFIRPPHDGVDYDNIYIGGFGKFESGMLIDFDIPLDPLPLPASIHPAHTTSNDLLRATAIILYRIGGLIAIVITPFINVSAFHAVMFLTVLGIAAYAVGSDKKQPYGRVVEKKTKKPIPHALVTLKNNEGIQKSFTVTDDAGGYFMLVEPGAYLFTVRMPAGSHDDRVYQKRIHTKTGWVAENVKI